MKKLKVKNLKFVTNIKDADLVTHSGSFHADEIFSTIVLSNIIDKDSINIIRVDEVNVESRAFIYDIGYGKYDHHQEGGNGCRIDGIKYCSFGLVWKDYGYKLLDKYGVCDIYKVYDIIDRKLVEMIDALDNGQVLPYKSEYDSIPSLVSLFNASWNENSNQDVNFINAYKFMLYIFNRIIFKIDSKIKARSFIEEYIEKSQDGIMIMDRFLPWKDVVLESDNLKAKDILFVIFPSNRSGYNIYSVPTGKKEFESRLLFPMSWAGLRDSEFQKLTGVNGAIFCHNARFMCSASTVEDSIMLAKLAILEK